MRAEVPTSEGVSLSVLKCYPARAIRNGEDKMRSKLAVGGLILGAAWAAYRKLRARPDQNSHHRRRIRRPLGGERVGANAPRNRRCGGRPGGSHELHHLLADGAFGDPEQRRCAPCCALPQAHTQTFGGRVLSG